MTTDNLPENFGQDEDLENEIGNFIVLTDEDDNDTTFELLAIMEYEEKNYVVWSSTGRGSPSSPCASSAS